MPGGALAGIALSNTHKAGQGCKGEAAFTPSETGPASTAPTRHAIGFIFIIYLFILRAQTNTSLRPVSAPAASLTGYRLAQLAKTFSPAHSPASGATGCCTHHFLHLFSFPLGRLSDHLRLLKTTIANHERRTKTAVGDDRHQNSTTCRGDTLLHSCSMSALP